MVTAEDEGTPPLEGDTPLPWDNEAFLTYATWVTFAPLLDVLSCPEAYGDAIFFNDSLFQGKVVLDVGCGVLGFFAALVGARKVYILPDTKEEFFARQLMQLVHDTKLGGDTVTVYDENIAKKQDIQGKVDIILSDLAGDVWLQHSKIYRLLNARDRYLKPNGAMYPSHCKLQNLTWKTDLSAWNISEVRVQVLSMAIEREMKLKSEHREVRKALLLTEEKREEAEGQYKHAIQTCQKQMELAAQQTDELQARLAENLATNECLSTEVLEYQEINKRSHAAVARLERDVSTLETKERDGRRKCEALEDTLAEERAKAKERLRKQKEKSASENRKGLDNI